MARITDNPKDGFEFELNRFFVKDEQTFIRKDNGTEVSLYDFTRSAMKNCGFGSAGDRLSDNQLDTLMQEWSKQGSSSIQGVIGTMYMAKWVAAELREALKEEE